MGGHGMIVARILGGLGSMAMQWRMVTVETGGKAKVREELGIYLASSMATVLSFPIAYLAFQRILVTVAGRADFLFIFVPPSGRDKAIDRGRSDGTREVL